MLTATLPVIDDAYLELLLPYKVPNFLAVEMSSLAFELTLAPSRLPFCRTVSGTGPEGLNGPLIQVSQVSFPVAVNLKFNILAQRKRRSASAVIRVGNQDSSPATAQSKTQVEADPEDLECIRQIQRVLELLRKNRDMLFGEVKLTVMIEDPREVERRRLLGIEDPDAPTRDDLVEALEQVHEGEVPENRVALRMLAKEMVNWPNLEVEVPKQSRGKSLYAGATDTGIDPKEAAKRLNMHWDSAAEIAEADVGDETEVPPAVGYGALYLVTAFPVIIGISVVLILFYNSLQ